MKKAQEEHQKEIEERAKHAKVNHPGSKDQLEEVWEEQDNLEGNEFDPETFFRLHGKSSSIICFYYRWSLLTD